MRTPLLAIVIGVLLASPSQAQVKITYVANEGFLLQDRQHKILIDALFDGGLNGYARIPDRMRPQLEGAEAPFDGVDLVLTTHYHRDHFGPNAVAKHLEANPAAHYVSTQQAVDQVTAKLANDSTVRSRIEAISLEHNASITIERNGIQLRVLDLHHGMTRSESNYGYLIELGGLTILHVGDTEATSKDFAAHRITDTTIDIALLPAWFLVYDEWIEAIREQIRPRVIVVMHMAERDAPADYFGSDGSYDRRLAAMKRNFPDAILIENAGQTRTFEPVAPNPSD